MQIRSLLALLCAFFVLSAPAWAKTINLAWDDAQVGVSYRVYHKTTAAGTYVKDCAAADTANCRSAGIAKTYAWLNAGPGQHYFVVSAYMPDPGGGPELESPYSNDVNSTVTPTAPILRIVSQSASVAPWGVYIRSRTSLPSLVMVAYGPDGRLSKAQWMNVKPATEQAVILANLREHTLYSYRLTAQARGNPNDVSTGTFLTR